MHNRIMKIRAENPQFDKKLVDIFAEKMPKLMLVMVEGEEFDNHIGSKDVAEMGKEFIHNSKGEHIGFHWTYDEIISVAKNFVAFDEVEFYENDVYLWANVKYGDYGHIIADGATIVKMAIADLKDEDYPFYPASQRAYCWLKKHIENSERE